MNELKPDELMVRRKSDPHNETNYYYLL